MFKFLKTVGLPLKAITGINSRKSNIIHWHYWIYCYIAIGWIDHFEGEKMRISIGILYA